MTESPLPSIPTQRRPSLAENAYLVASVLGARYRAVLANSAWVDAAAVFGLLASVLLLVTRLLEFTDSQWPQYLRAAGWGAVVLAVLIGLRRPAAALAWSTVLGETVLLSRQYDTDPVAAVHVLWPLALGVVAAAALTVPAPRRRAVAVLRAPRLLTFILGTAIAEAVVAVIQRQQAAPTGKLWLAPIALGVLAAGIAALTLPAAVRRRLVVLAAPVGTLAAIVGLTLQGWAYSNGYIGRPIYLVPVQWTLLVAVPLAAFVLGALLVRWRERYARPAALGRAADRSLRLAEAKERTGKYVIDL